MAWFIVPYDLVIGHTGKRNRRVCAMDRFTTLIQADGGKWSESECLGNHAIVKVSALPTTLTLLAAEPGFQRIPKDALDDSLSSLSNAQKTAITNKLESLGYPTAEIRADLGNNIGTKTLRDVLRFALKRRLKPRYDPIGDTVILDGPVQVCKTIEAVNAEV